MMKKNLRRLLIALLSVTVMFAMGATAFAADGDSGQGTGFDNSTALPDGNYAVTFAGGTTKVTLTCNSIQVTDGKAFGTFGTSSADQTHIFVGTLEEADKVAPESFTAGTLYPIENQSFTIPVDLSKQMTIYAYTTKMGGKWTSYALDIQDTPDLPRPFTVTNSTGMFNVKYAYKTVSGSDTTLTLILGSDGYHYLFKGTYDEAFALGNDSSKWIAGTETEITNDRGKHMWQFIIPVEGTETMIPIVSISNSKLSGGDFQAALFPRMIEPDWTNAALTVGDYEETMKLSVINNVSMFNPGTEADYHVIGGPNSNNYSTKITLQMGSTSYDRVSTMEYSNYANVKTEKGQICRDLDSDKKFKEVPVLPGETAVLYFHSAKKDRWYPRDVLIDTSAKTATFDAHVNTEADNAFDAAQDAIAAAKEDLTVKEKVVAALTAVESLTDAEKVMLEDNITVLNDAKTAIEKAEKAAKEAAEKAAKEAEQKAKEKAFADATIEAIPAQTYNGKAKKPAVVVKAGSTTLKAGTDYSAAYSNNINAGKATVTLTGMGSYAGTKTANFTINKAKNKLKVKAVKKTRTAKSNKKTVIPAKKAFKVTKNVSKGKVTYKKTKGSKKIIVSSKGKVTVKKGLKKGKVYTVKVRATSKATKNYKKATKIVTLKIRIK